MLLQILRAKLHNLRLTNKNLNYEGSITLDIEFLKRAGIKPYEKALVVNISNGARLETYIIPGPSGSKDVILNGASARLAEVGDRLIVMVFAFASTEEVTHLHPKVLVFDENNNIIEEKEL